MRKGCLIYDEGSGRIDIRFVCWVVSLLEELPYFYANLQTGGVPYEVSMALRVGKAAP